MGFITNLWKEQRHSQFIKKLIPWTIYALLPIALFRLYFHPIHLPDSSIHQIPQIIVSSSSSSSSLSPPHFSPSSVHEGTRTRTNQDCFFISLLFQVFCLVRWVFFACPCVCSSFTNKQSANLFPFHRRSKCD